MPHPVPPAAGWRPNPLKERDETLAVLHGGHYGALRPSRRNARHVWKLALAVLAAAVAWGAALALPGLVRFVGGN